MRLFKYTVWISDFHALQRADASSPPIAHATGLSYEQAKILKSELRDNTTVTWIEAEPVLPKKVRLALRALVSCIPYFVLLTAMHVVGRFSIKRAAHIESKLNALVKWTTEPKTEYY